LRYFILPLLLAGCVTPASYDNGDNTTRQADIDSCMADATRQVPQRLDYAGIDLNAQIRMRAFDACMSEKGYSKS